MLWLEKNPRLLFSMQGLQVKNPSQKQQKGLLITGRDYILQGNTDKTLGPYLSMSVSTTEVINVKYQRSLGIKEA